MRLCQFRLLGTRPFAVNGSVKDAPPTPHDAVAREKTALRARMRAWRDSLEGAVKARAAEAIAERGLILISELRSEAGHRPGQGAVSAFAAMPDELNVWPLLRRLHGAGVPLALPMVE